MKKIGFRELLRYIFETSRISDYVPAFLAMIAVTMLGMTLPYITNRIYSNMIYKQSIQLLIGVFLLLLCVKLSQTVIGVYKTFAFSKLTRKMDVAFQAAGMARLLSMPASFFQGFSAGDLASRMNYLGRLCTMLINSVMAIGLTSVFSLAYIWQMVRHGPGMVIPGLLVILFTVIASVVSIVVQMNRSRLIMEGQAKESGLAYALVAGIQKIKVAGAEKRAFAKWAEAYTPVAKLHYMPPLFLKLCKIIPVCITVAGSLVIYYFAIKTKVSLSHYFAFQTAYGMVMGNFVSLVEVASNFAQIRPVLELIEPILKTEPEVAGDQIRVEGLTGAVEFSHVTFAYGEQQPKVIDDLSLKIRPGQYVALVGETGCGKSTLMRLMLGFEKPQKGAVYYDRQDLNSLDLKSLRRKIGVVLQNGKLFQGDIFSNITISAPMCTLQEAWEAAEMAGIAEDIRRMPMGMQTVISEGSGGVSGGQRQRLMIARAIAAKPQIIMLDEATSALDNLSQKIVSDSLAQLSCTRIVIAHRLSTIKQCDRILVMDKGKIADEGTFEELMERNTFFAELVERQQLET